MELLHELRWRGLLQDSMPGIEEQLQKGMSAGYIGFDPTADSLHIGSLVQIMTLVHIQRAGHKPIALLGGATGMVGDPSFKSEERKLLDEATLEANIAGIRKQLEKFLDFEAERNPAELVNNLDWFKDFGFLEFIRDVGKHISVNYMMAKDSVKKRLETGISFTEFSYQLLQGYDFYWLYKNKGVKFQAGGADQWGNITTGTELIRRMSGGEAWAFTTPLVTKADGSKFGKTERGNVWLDPEKTSPYEFYQFWLNASDEDAERYIKFFTLKEENEISACIAQHREAPHLRELQRILAEDVTLRVHGADALQRASKASEILFGKATEETLKSLDEKLLLEIFRDVPQFEIPGAELRNGVPVLELTTSFSSVFSSKGEARRLLQANGVSLNKNKINDQRIIDAADLLAGKYLLIQKGKKDYYLLISK